MSIYIAHRHKNASNAPKYAFHFWKRTKSKTKVTDATKIIAHVRLQDDHVGQL